MFEFMHFVHALQLKDCTMLPDITGEHNVCFFSIVVKEVD